MSRARLLLLCPGQGGQHPDMFKLARTNQAANALANRLLADDALTRDGADIFANRIAQPLIVAATLSMWEAIKDFAPPPALVAGYSIGELSAYGVAGAITSEQAMTLAARRAQLMDDCQRTAPGQALLTISGLTLASASALATRHRYHISIETGEDACIVGGPAAQAEALQQAIEAVGARSHRLPVEVASHTPYMQSAVAPFAQALVETGFGLGLATETAPATTAAAAAAAITAPAPATATATATATSAGLNAPGAIATPVLAGIDASTVRDHGRAIDTLSRQLAQTIHWLACMDAAAEAGITVALELGPGNALSRMLQNRHPHISTRSVADFRTLDGIHKWLDRAADD